FSTDTLRALATGKATRAWAERWRGNGPPILNVGIVVCASYALAAYVVAAAVTARRAILVLAISAGAALALAARPAEAAEHPMEFRVDEIEAPGHTQDIEITDVDMDGKEDLV